MAGEPTGFLQFRQEPGVSLLLMPHPFIILDQSSRMIFKRIIPCRLFYPFIQSNISLAGSDFRNPIQRDRRAICFICLSITFHSDHSFIFSLLISNSDITEIDLPLDGFSYYLYIFLRFYKRNYDPTEIVAIICNKNFNSVHTNYTKKINMVLL